MLLRSVNFQRSTFCQSCLTLTQLNCFQSVEHMMGRRSSVNQSSVVDAHCLLHGQQTVPRFRIGPALSVFAPDQNDPKGRFVGDRGEVYQCNDVPKQFCACRLQEGVRKLKKVPMAYPVGNRHFDEGTVIFWLVVFYNF